jgi:hypothetical protein
MPANNISSHIGQDLDDLAGRIRQAHDRVHRTSAETLTLALAAGDLLVEAKSQVPPKKWGAWLRANCFMGSSTARLYIQLAEHRTEIENEVSRFPDLSLRAARKLIAKPPKSETKTEKSAAAAPAPAPTLIEAWNTASGEARAAFLESVGVPELLAVASDPMKIEIVRRTIGSLQSRFPDDKRIRSIKRKIEQDRAYLLAAPAAGNA